MIALPRFSSTAPAPKPAATSADKPSNETVPTVSSSPADPFFRPFPKPKTFRERLALWWRRRVDPENNMTPREKALYTLIDKLERDLDSGALRPTGQPVKVSEYRSDVSKTDTCYLYLVHDDGRKFTLRILYNRCWGRRVARLDSCLLSDDGNKSLNLNSCVYKDKTQNLSIENWNRHVSAKNRQLARKLVKLLEDTEKADQERREEALEKQNRDKKLAAIRRELDEHNNGPPELSL